MRLGVLLGSGEKTCGGYTGSLGYEMSDAVTIDKWGVQYLRYDSCYANTHSAISRYTDMGNALAAARSRGYGFIHYNIDNWGNE